MRALLPAIHLGWRGRVTSPFALPFPWRARVALALSFALAHPLCWWIARGRLSRRAGLLVERMSSHRLHALRALAETWKLIAVVTG
ncbi:MAG: hypothetical protein H6741_08000 [Alphaproteobacteria bacterium]|nr:hypothetical protein [Alphaproteobacteria bacterium]MCB9792659.1 hypothetical protein [Alphaproteobacteria bacterium]